MKPSHLGHLPRRFVATERLTPPEPPPDTPTVELSAPTVERESRVKPGSVRSSPEAYRAYHADRMRRRRAAKATESAPKSSCRSL
jgi:hypothetical protein